MDSTSNEPLVASVCALGVAIDSGLPVVPVSIAGSRHVMLKGRLMTCPGDVTITIHEPISTVGVGREGARALAEQVRTVVVRDVS